MFNRLRLGLVLTALLGVALFASGVSAQPDVSPEPSSAPTPEPTPSDEPTPAPTSTPQPVAVQTSPAPQYNPPAEALKVTPENADIRIGIHNTSETGDDYVRVGEMEPCSIRLNSPLGEDVNIVLTSPDDDFRFNGGTPANQLYLTLPGDGSVVPFSIIGVTPSRFVGSSEIHAHVGYATSHPYKNASLTVFKLVNAKVSVTRGRDYERETSTDTAFYRPNGNAQAVDMMASISVDPVGVDFSAPQIRDLQVAIVQNVTSSSRRATARYPRALSWSPTLGAGYTLSVSATAERSVSFSGPVLDTTLDSANISTFVYDPSAIGPLSRSVQSNDSPAYNIGTGHVYSLTDASGTPYVTYKYSTVRFFMRDNFLTYCFLVNGNAHQALRQTSWYLNLDSSDSAQHAIVSASDSTVQNPPALAPPLANDVGAQNDSFSFSAATTNLRKISPSGSSAP